MVDFSAAGGVWSGLWGYFLSVDANIDESSKISKMLVLYFCFT
jgi:hypothetical protein